MTIQKNSKRMTRLKAILLALCVASGAAPVFANGAAGKLTSEEATKAKASLELINSKLAKVSKTQAQVKLIESDEINILRSTAEDKVAISITTALVQHFADDRDAIASLIALQHVRQSKVSEKLKSPTASRFLGALSSAVGSVVDEKSGVSGLGQTMNEGGTEAINSAYSQTQSRAADEAGINWMLEAGYNPHGAVRAQRELLTLSEAGKTSAMNELQRVSADRVAYLEALVDDNAKAKALSSDSKSPLWPPNKSSSTVATAPASVDITAAAAAPSSVQATPVSAGSGRDEPIDGVSLSRYAAIKNDIAYMGESAALAKHSLAQDAFSKLDQQWTDRMAQDKSLDLSRRYATQYLEASQGDYADWGRDVAQVRQTGRLQLGTDPTAVDDWLSLLKAQKEAASAGSAAAAVFAQRAKEKGLSVYDFQIVNAWWSQRAKDHAAKGDQGLLRRME
jgi:hypothetical protein